MKSIYLAFALLLILLAGCAITPTQKQIDAADYGTYPANYEEIIKAYMGSILKDPESAKYQFLNAPKQGWNSVGGLKFAYIVCVNINTRNSYGGYTGNQMSHFMIKNGLVIDSTHWNSKYGDVAARELCASYI
jgi:hypothetical protein